MAQTNILLYTFTYHYIYYTYVGYGTVSKIHVENKKYFTAIHNFVSSRVKFHVKKKGSVILLQKKKLRQPVNISFDLFQKIILLLTIGKEWRLCEEPLRHE